MTILGGTKGSLRMRLLSTLAAMVVCACPAGAKKAGGDTAIKSIIPHNRPGTETCFEGRFSDKTVDMKQWPTYAEQLRRLTDANGEPLPPPRMHERPNQSVSHVVLYLNYTNGRRARNESWDFNFTVRVTSPTLGKELFARSGCAWSGYDYKTDKEIEPEFMLSCWIECDGGGMRALRVPATASVDLIFDRLKMQHGCEGGGTHSVGASETKVAFRLERAPLAVCKALKAW
ncbi:MAG: hypothetical protein ACOYLQ_20100 [Hyphomicrobiaceae bacterium]